MGTPKPLQSFMVIIELVSSVIRPFTLRVRLIANIIAGHLLLTLLGGAINGRLGFLFFVFLGMCLILILELGVAFIQAYVFTILSTLYMSEVNTLKINK